MSGRKRKEKLHRRGMHIRSGPIGMVRYGSRGLIRFEVIYRLLCMLVFIPVLNYVESLLLLVNGTGNIAAYNVLDALKNPLTWIVLAVLAAGMSFFASVEQYGLISILHGAYSGQRVGAKEAFANGLDLGVHFCRPRNALLLFYFLVVYPFSQLLDNSSITRYITIPGFIREHFTKYPSVGMAAFALGVVLFYVGLRWAYVLPLMVIEDRDFMDARRKSVAYTRGREGLLLLLHVLEWVVIMGVIFVFGALALFIVLCLIALWLEPGIDLAAFLSSENNYMLLIIGGMIFGWFTVPLIRGVILNRYYTLSKAFGEDVPLYKKEMHFRHTETLRRALIAACAVVMFFSIPTRYAQFKTILRGNTGDVLIMAHRGYSAAAPENTLPAFQAALDVGATAVELDVQMTRDGEIVVLHDDSIKRTTGVDKKIWEVTYDEIKDLDNGSFFSPEFAGTRIPTLDEALRFCKGRLYVNIEIKRTGHDEGIEDRVVQIIRDNEFRDECDVTSQDYETLEYINARYPDILLAYTSVIGIGNVHTLEAVDILSIQETFATYDTVAAMHRAGKKVFVWTVNEEETMERLIGLGVDAILTNDPVKGHKVIAGHRGLRDVYLRIRQILYYLT